MNDRADIAFATGADVLHLGQRDLPTLVARGICGPDIVVGRSTHSFSQVNAAIAETGSDYFCVGPCWATPTKPGRPAAGIDAGRLDQVIEAGAGRVVVVRAITEADDPEAAARALRGRLTAPAVPA